MKFDRVKDSGERQEFSTGSHRDTQKGKGRYDLIPVDVLRRFAQHYENGAVKYGDRNWEKGQPLSRYYNSAMRHLLAWFNGETDEDHLAAVMWNVSAIIHTEELIRASELPNELNDVPNLILLEQVDSNQSS